VESTGLARFLFELASEERLGILAAIADKPLRHAQIARHLRMTDSETTRHLNRLTGAGLVTKGPQSQYEPTSLARLVSAGFLLFRFMLAHREFLLNHNVLVLPPEFVERLGALCGGSLTRGTYNVVATQERSLRGAKRRIWVLSEQAFEQALPILREKASGGADVRVIRPREVFHDTVPLSAVRRNYPVRLLGETKVFLAVVDHVAGVCFPNLHGEVDMATMVFLDDRVGSKWAEDLFLHFWDQAREPLDAPTSADG
jgi:predicted transcriptional regulator